MTAAWSLPAFVTSSAHFLCSGSADFFHSSSCAALIRYTSWSGIAFILASPARSKSAHGLANLAAHCVVQLSSITFFCDADMALEVFGLISHWKVVVTTC